MKFFSYGIFMLSGVGTNRCYATVKGWKTEGGLIVQAIRDREATLTGVLMDITEVERGYLDRIERGYDRIEVVTTSYEMALMYVKKGE